MLLAKLWPTVARLARREIRARRLRRALCAHCGYDLRATPNACPECGLATTIPAS